MKLLLAAVLAAASLPSAAARTQTDGEALRAELQKSYPSLAYVERYRQTFPNDVQGGEQLWHGPDVPALANTEELYKALVALQDQHVSLAGPKAGKPETLGIILRTSTDNHVVVWRVTDPSVRGVTPGDLVVAIDGEAVGKWLAAAAALTFGGNHRSRVAEAALKLGIGTPVDHASVGLGASVSLTLRRDGRPARTVALPYLPMTGERAGALANALNSNDLPPVIEAGGYRVATLRIGAFAPQYDPAFTAAADAAAKQAEAAPAPGAGDDDDGPMLAGFCAVVRKLVSEVDVNSLHADALLIDMRGNFGGFGREARLIARALTAAPLPRSVDVFSGKSRGQLKLVAQPEDASCGQMAVPLRLIVWTDAGTRSSGELMTAWLWGAGAVVAGERTIGAGGGLDSEAGGYALPHSGYRVRSSGNFTFFDLSGTLHDGETSEAALIDVVAADQFAPSWTRPFAIQAVGMRPDLQVASGEADLLDGGRAAAARMLGELAHRGLLAPPGKIATVQKQ